MPARVVNVSPGWGMGQENVGKRSSPSSPSPGLARPARPAIVQVPRDGLGHGDVSGNNPKSKIATPHSAKWAAQGGRFTDRHLGQLSSNTSLACET